MQVLRAARSTAVTGNAVPARIAPDPDRLDKHPRRVSLSTDPKVNPPRRSGSMSSKQAPRCAILGSDGYPDNLRPMDALLGKTLRANGGLAAHTPDARYVVSHAGR